MTLKHRFVLLGVRGLLLACIAAQGVAEEEANQGAQAGTWEDQDINTVLMKSTIKVVGPSKADPGKMSFGSAFILGQPDSSNVDVFYPVLVTAAHVLDGMAGDVAAFSLRIKNGEKTKLQEARLHIRIGGVPQWVRHPDADVVAIRLSLPKEVDLRLVSTSFIADEKVLGELRIRPGDELCILGFPHGVAANDLLYPILRSGRIASYPIRPVSQYKTFLLDMEVFPGNSGGPVYLYENNRFTEAGHTLGTTSQALLGIVIGQQVLREEIKTFDETGTREHQLGIAVVLQASFIREVIALLPPIVLASAGIPGASPPEAKPTPLPDPEEEEQPPSPPQVPTPTEPQPK